jgi:hypothetical protein
MEWETHLIQLNLNHQSNQNNHPFINHPFINHPFINHPFINQPFTYNIQPINIFTNNNIITIIICFLFFITYKIYIV